MNNYKENICANIAYLRKTHDLSRTAMCKLIHVSPQTLDKMEQGIFPNIFVSTFSTVQERPFKWIPMT